MRYGNILFLPYLCVYLFQADSIFNLRRPDDLMALLKQAERADSMDSLKLQLLRSKEDIDKNEDKDTGLKQAYVHTREGQM